MTAFVQTTDVIGPARAFEFTSNNDELFVTQGTTLASTANAAVVSDFTQSSLVNNGTIFSVSNAVNFNTAGNTIVNGLTGVISNAPNNNATFTVISGGSSTINNLGEISHAGTGWAVVVSAGSNSISNSGTVSSTGGGVLFGYQNGTGTLTNTGTIIAGSQGTFLPDIASSGVGILTANNVVVNFGTITATSGAGIGMDGTVNGTVIENHGILSSTQNAALDMSSVSANQFVSVVNSGTMTGFTNAVSGGAGEIDMVNSGEIFGAVIMGSAEDRFENSGTVFGDVELGMGVDVYRGDGDSTVSFGVFGGAGEDRMFGGQNADVMSGDDDGDKIRGRAGDDELYGGAGEDDIKGNDGDDVIQGNQDNDVLRGGRGDDVIFGGSGEDEIIGGAGNDVLSGNSGNDVFVFSRKSGIDEITDFTNNRDKLDLSAFDVTSRQELTAAGAIKEDGAGSLIDLRFIGGDGFIYVEDMTVLQWGNTDFIF